MSDKFIITVDLGGTKILTALLNYKKEIIIREKISTDYKKGKEYIVRSIAESVNSVIDHSGINQDQVDAVCLGVPGTVDPLTGIIGNAPNLEITNYNIKEALQKYFPMQVLIENDVNLGGLGIKKYELNDKVNNMLVVFVGTGIGGALFFNGKLYRGSSFYAGEIGHMRVNKAGSFSDESTFENLASRTAIVKGIVDEIKNNKDSILSEKVNKNKKIKSNALAKALKKNDKIVTKHVSNACSIIGNVLGSITTLLNIDTIVLGGGAVEAMGDYMLPKIRKSFSETVLKEPGKHVEILITELGDDAPLYGGIALAEEFLQA